MSEPTLNILAQRLGRVERENRTLKQLGAVMLAGFAAVALMGQRQPFRSKREKAMQILTVTPLYGDLSSLCERITDFAPYADACPQKPISCRPSNYRAMKVALLIGLAAVSIYGCRSMALRQQREGWQEFFRIAAECKSRRLAGELSGHLQSAQCSTGRMRAVMEASGYPYMDLVDLWLAYRMAVARRIDEGTIAEEEANLKLTELLTRINTEAQRRDVLAQQAYSHRLQSVGVFLQGLAAWQESLTPPAPQIRGPINCYQYGNFIQCN